MSSPPYTVDLSADQARELAQSGGALLLLDVPTGTVVGIDQQSFMVGPSFKGVKMLPPGPHLVSYNAFGAGGSGDFAPAVSFYAHLAPRQVLVRRWDAREELLLPLPDADEEERLAAAVRRFDFDASLAPYDLKSYARWRQLSCHINAGVLDRLTPAGGSISVTAEADPALLAPTTEAESRLAEQLQHKLSTTMAQDAPADGPGRAAASGGEQASTSAAQPAASPSRHVGRCFYARIPRNVKKAGLSTAELTALNLDKSALLEQVIARQYGADADGILGELQFAFLTFLLGQSLEAFGQWKALLHLLLACKEAPLRTRTPLYIRALAALRAQLQHCLAADRGPEAQGPSPLGLPMTEELLAGSFLKRLFARFSDTLHAAGGSVPPQLQVEWEALQAVLEGQLGWSLDIGELGGDSDDEDAPVVVEL